MIKLISTMLLMMATFVVEIHAQGCVCEEPNPPCPPPDPACSTFANPATWVNGWMDQTIDVNGEPCIVRVYFCSRNLSGTPCAFGAPYEVNCEYKVTKVCFPEACSVNCESFEMNAILQGIAITIATANPHGHTVPTSAQWNAVPPLKAAWKLSFPACFSCVVDTVTKCVTFQGCNEESCYAWYEAYTCVTPCPSAIPFCPSPCPTGIQLNMIPGSKGKSVGECPTQSPRCILCGY